MAHILNLLQLIQQVLLINRDLKWLIPQLCIPHHQVIVSLSGILLQFLVVSLIQLNGYEWEDNGYE